MLSIELHPDPLVGFKELSFGLPKGYGSEALALIP